MEAHPDSALLRLDSIRSLKESWPKRLRMRYDLLEAKAQNKAFVDFTSDSIAKEFTKYYDSHDTANERMMAHYLLGCVYRDLGEAPHAVDCYLDAISQADTTAKDCDFYTLSCAYAQMADIYYRQLLLSYSTIARKRASYYAFKANKPVYAISDLERIASAYILQNKKDSAELILIEVQHLYQRYGLLQNALQSFTKLIHIYVNDSNKLIQTKELIDKYDSEFSSFDKNHELQGAKRKFYFYKGRYFEGVNQLDSAEYYYRKIYRPNMSYTAMDPMYRGLQSVFTKRHQADSIAKYSQLLCLANDSSIAKKDQDLTAQMAASYNYNRYQKEALENEKIAHHTQIILISILIGVAIIALFLYTIWRNHLKKQEKLRTEYDSATKALENNLQTLQMLDVSYQEVIAVIKEELDKTRNESHTRLEALTAEYEQNKTELEEEKDWDMLYTEIAKYFPNILQDLNSSPKITKQKTRVCLLVSLRIQDNCIANWLDLKPNRVSNIKSELNQELFNETSARTLYNNLRRKYNIIYSTESR